MPIEQIQHSAVFGVGHGNADVARLVRKVMEAEDPAPLPLTVMAEHGIVARVEQGARTPAELRRLTPAAHHALHPVEQRSRIALLVRGIDSQWPEPAFHDRAAQTYVDNLSALAKGHRRVWLVSGGDFNQDFGRDHATLGDIFTMGVCNRYPVEVQKRYGDKLPPGVIDSLRRITNVRPALATPLWVSGQIRRHAESAALEKELKKVWDDLCDQFLQLDAVREQDKAFKFDIVDALQLVLKISKRASFQTLDDIVVWVHNKLRESDRSLAEHALQEPAFLDNSARFIVYGHTHQHEVVPLDSDGEPPNEQNQFYFNSGTWRSYYDLALKDIKEQKFVRYQTFTYLTFYKDDERSGRRFETWSGAYV